MTRARWLITPTGLSPAALKVWEYYGPGLARIGALKPENAESLKALCRLLALAEAAAGEIERDGVTIATTTGSRRPHPACAVLFQAQKQAEPLLRQFDLDSTTVHLHL